MLTGEMPLGPFSSCKQIKPRRKPVKLEPSDHIWHQVQFVIVTCEALCAEKTSQNTHQHRYNQLREEYPGLHPATSDELHDVAFQRG
jgi:hypothetical protein